MQWTFFLLFCCHVFFQGVSSSQCVNATQVNKTCVCESSLILSQPILLTHFTNYTDIENSSLTAIGTWDKVAVEQLCKDAKCDKDVLSAGIASLDLEIQSITSNSTELQTYRDKLRQMVDCNGNSDVINSLFDVYQQVCSRMVVVKNVLQDLQIKRGLLKAEETRCIKRSWLRGVLESMWHKTN